MFRLIAQYFLDNWIAITSLTITLYTLFRNRVDIDVNIEKKANWRLAILLNDGKSIANDFGFVQANIKIVNSSNIDIGFFDLRAINPGTSEDFIFYNEKQAHIFNGLEDTKAISILSTDKNHVGVNLPPSNHGILKAHSLTSIDIVISPETDIEKFYILFKISKKRTFLDKIPYGYINSPYKSFFGSVSVEQSCKPNYSEAYAPLHKE